MDADLAAAAVPYIAAAVGTYGVAVLERVRDETADAAAEATVGAGRRLLRRLLRVEASAGRIDEAVQDLAQDPADDDRLAVLRGQIRKALAADTELAADIAKLLSQSAPVATIGPRSVAAPHNSGIVQTGDASTAWQRHP